MNFTKDLLHAARRPIASLISKSEKAQLKLSPGTWQYTMLQDHLEALHIASALIDRNADIKSIYGKAQLHKAALTFASMIKKTEDIRKKFPIGTSQYSLQQNRLEALFIGEALIKAEQGAAANP